MSNAVTTTGTQSGLSIHGLNEALDLAKTMASARMVPNCLQGSPGDCLMVIEQAMRWGMSPFAVAQATSVVRGKFCFEGKLVSAAIQSSGVLEGRLSYEFSGEDDDRKVICSGTIKGEAKPRTVEVALGIAKTTNEWWTKTPDQMLTYHAARVWARRHTPEVMLGVYSPDEFDQQPRHAVQNDNVVDIEEAPKPPVKEKLTLEDRIITVRDRVEKCRTEKDLADLENNKGFQKWLKDIFNEDATKGKALDDLISSKKSWFKKSKDASASKKQAPKTTSKDDGIPSYLDEAPPLDMQEMPA